MDIELISFDLCPFVQRSVITLFEKDVPFQISYIDLSDKPAWFTAISPLGKVPVLKVDGHVLFESAVINEYLDEAVGEDRFLPADPLARARDRMWIEFLSSMGGPLYRMMISPDEDEVRAMAGKVNALLTRLEDEVEGPLWSGEGFSLVDSTAAPALQRIRWNEGLVPNLGITRGLPRIAAWTDALLDRASVQRSVKVDIHDRYIAYLQGGGSPTRAVEGGWLGTQA